MTLNQSVFHDHAKDWWNPEGTFKPLHMFHPLRMDFIVSHIKDHFEKDTLKDLNILDVGCGGGLICESLARLGVRVTGVDLSEEAIQVAKDHAKEGDLDIAYKVSSLSDIQEKFDVVIASEVIEHVEDQKSFVHDMANHLNPGGCFVITTLNRTLKSKILGIWAAEYILKWAPVGAHDHDFFVRPSELFKMCQESSLSLTQLSGLSFNPLTWEFNLSKDMDINYFAFGVK